MKKILIGIFIILVIVIDVVVFTKNNEIKEEVTETMKIKINDKIYDVMLEDNDVVKSLVTHLPLKVTMNELNGNEKYVYLDFNIPSDNENIDLIEKGDVMLYGSSCLVIFYKTFNTNYSYTKIGHINNLEDLGNDSIEVEITK